MNGGGTWTPLSLPLQNYVVSSVASPAPGVYYVLYNAMCSASMYVTTDNASTWHVLSGAQGTGSFGCLNMVDFVSPTEGWAYQAAIAEHTTDSGLTWPRSTSISPMPT